MQNEIEFTTPELADTSCVTVGILCDILKPTSAIVIARYRQDYYAGKPAITLNQFGTGRVIYVGVVGDRELYDVLAKWLLDTAGIQKTFTTPPGVEISQRIQGDKQIHFVLNHTDLLQMIHLENHFINLLSKKHLHGAVQLEPHDVLILDASNPE
jgi:beta-galactosidase